MLEIKTEEIFPPKEFCKYVHCPKLRQIESLETSIAIRGNHVNHSAYASRISEVRKLCERCAATHYHRYLNNSHI